MRRDASFPARGWLVPLLIAALPMQDAVQDPDAATKAAAVRAALLHKLALYLEVEAPAPPEPAPKEKRFRIGVLGDDATITTARTILPGKTVGDAKVVVVTVTAEDAVAGRATQHCDLLYIATPIAAETLQKIVEQHGKAPLPLVCGQPGFCIAGGTVQLFVKDGGTRFEVNTEVLRRQGLRASPHLLKHAQKGPTQ